MEDKSVKKEKKISQKPKASASSLDEGSRKKGGDGKMWVVKADKNGRKAWRPHKSVDTKRSTRPSPATPASSLPEGSRRKGNDGSSWKVKVNSTGIHKWVPLKSGKNESSNTKDSKKSNPSTRTKKITKSDSSEEVLDSNPIDIPIIGNDITLDTKRKYTRIFNET
jgi:hypothetical protein